MDREEEGTPAAMTSNGANLRTGTIPVSFDPERRKMLWYYFVVTAMKSDEVVSALLSSHQAISSALGGIPGLQLCCPA